MDTLKVAVGVLPPSVSLTVFFQDPQTWLPKSFLKKGPCCMDNFPFLFYREVSLYVVFQREKLLANTLQGCSGIAKDRDMIGCGILVANSKVKTLSKFLSDKG